VLAALITRPLMIAPAIEAMNAPTIPPQKRSGTKIA